MTKTGKILAAIAGILTLLGTYLFSLVTVPGLVNYGVGGIIVLITNLFPVMSGWTAWIWVFVIGYMIYLLSFVLQLIGIKSRIAAFFGSLLPLTVVVFVFLGAYGVWTDGLGNLMAFGTGSLVDQWIPMTFGFGLASPAIPGLLIDLGTFIVGVGGLLSLVSVFISREDY